MFPLGSWRTVYYFRRPAYARHNRSAWKSAGQSAFEAEISFLLQHYSLINDARRSYDMCILDFSPIQDMAYAEVNLPPNHRKVFEKLYRHICRDVGEPNLIVYLTCSAAEQLGRMGKRDRSAENKVDLQYLKELNLAIDSQITNVSQNITVLKIDSKANDFAHRSSTQRKVVGMIADEVGAVQRFL